MGQSPGGQLENWPLTRRGRGTRFGYLEQRGPGVGAGEGWVHLNRGLGWRVQGQAEGAFPCRAVGIGPTARQGEEDPRPSCLPTPRPTRRLIVSLGAPGLRGPWEMLVRVPTVLGLGRRVEPLAWGSARPTRT